MAARIQKVLCPVDYSRHSAHALEYAGHIAAAFGARLDILHLWDRPHYVSPEAIVEHPSGQKQSLADLIATEARSEMQEFMARVTLPEGVTVEQRLQSGEPCATILAELARGGHDLIVMGTHGRTGFRRLILGSVTEKIVRLSPIPVITVPAPHE